MNCEKGTSTEFTNDYPIYSARSAPIKVQITRRGTPKPSRTPLKFSRENSPIARSSPSIESVLLKKKKTLWLKRVLVHFNYTKKNYLNRSVDKYFPHQARLTPRSPRPKDTAANKEHQLQTTALTARNSKILSCIKQSKIDLTPSKYFNLRLKLI